MDEKKETRWNLTVHFRDKSGRDVAPTRRKSCIEGLLCTVDAPVVPGMEPDQKSRGGEFV